MLVTELIANDHRLVQTLFFELEASPSAGREAFERLVVELDVHAQAEEAVFYPAVRQASRRIDDAEAGHEHMRQMIDAVRAVDPGSREFLLALRELKQVVLNHAMEEEAGIFMDAQRLGLAQLAELGTAMEAEKRRLMAAPIPERRVA
ncbi:MAG: hemerythrin domain-containing protein [Candidatus Rokubacteria bacterium]|nr:hemerythrin domain-containing protein [Candidatus Rokubacteria bacterium]